MNALFRRAPRPFFGGGLLGALMNALKLLQGFCEYVADVHIQGRLWDGEPPAVAPQTAS